MALRSFLSSLKLLHKGFLLLFALIVAFDLFLGLGIIWGESSVLAWNDLRNKQQELSAELQKLDHKRMELSREIRLLKTDPQFVEKNIRQKLNYVKKDEILYLFEEKAPAAKETDFSHD